MFDAAAALNEARATLPQWVVWGPVISKRCQSVRRTGTSARREKGDSDPARDPSNFTTGDVERSYAIRAFAQQKTGRSAGLTNMVCNWKDQATRGVPAG